MALEEMAKGLQDAQRALLLDLWNEQQAHSEQMHAQWDEVWEQAVHAVLPSWSVASRRARAVLETVCRLYAQALRGSHTLAHDTLSVRRDGIVALMHELRTLMGTHAEPPPRAPSREPESNPINAMYRVLDEHALLRECTALVAEDSDPVRIFDTCGVEVLFIPPCDIYATDQPPNILYSLHDFDAHGVREELLVAAYAEMATMRKTVSMTTVWQIGKNFGVGATTEHCPNSSGTSLLLEVQRSVLRHIFLASPPSHAACLVDTLRTAQCLLLVDGRSVHEAVARAPQPPPVIWLPLPECYTAFVVDVIIDGLLRAGCAPTAPSQRTMPCTSAAPPTQSWPVWLRYYITPPSGAEFVRGWPGHEVRRLRDAGGRCDPAFRRGLLTPPVMLPHA